MVSGARWRGVALLVLASGVLVAGAAEAPKAAPESVEQQLDAAMNLASAKKTQDAVRAFERVLQQEPENARAHLLLGDVYLYHLRDYDQALAHFLRAAGSEDHKIQALALEQAGDITMMVKHDWAGAAQQYRRVLAIWPNHIKTRYNLGGCLANAGQWDEAIAEMEAVIKLAPKAEDPELATRAREAIAAIREKQIAAAPPPAATP